ncbi:zinc-binding dehydrogenase [Amycolatopsis magusensis]|uniref:2-desacetyl-2-hydroxyethyl bacteriochlorophyllide A dehydrogenase n=1 Tax=Amycolatopsis magusensis TaxID=882444 RepID=A0ABS4PVU4_9PSEU|nr:zinc-binding dehydrogenase [Amycolatopsis magusensis]MBP2183020.1 2-desacetyl-2-hydroxyethyl bacteriochlorophyllide A dehydrogenase [Amycolatopsis magusensis]MDI5981405.1 zinc-binding dehydrogenase [Amycolatopsis magusensis]
MPGVVQVVQFTGPRRVELAEIPADPLGPGQVRVRTRFSGISAGTELTAYRGTNPYLTRTWNAERRLFTDTAEIPGLQYPVVGWGYSEAGEVVEAAPGTGFAPGDQVWGIWGHRSGAVLPAEKVRPVPEGLDPLAASFARVGAVALNAILAADMHLGEVVTIFGQGVIGLLATQMARQSGAEVVAVDALAPRRAEALKAGAVLALDPVGEQVAEGVREHSGGSGADVAIELSGSYLALHEAIRTVAPGGRVVAAGFYQDEGRGLRLGEEFHHNRVELVSSQIGGVTARLSGRWDQARLNETFLRLSAQGLLDPASLVTHQLPPSRVAEAYRLLDTSPGDALQIVLDFDQE